MTTRCGCASRPSTTASENSAPAYRTLSPCGRGWRRTCNKHSWVRGRGPNPSPILAVETPSSPLPQGARAQYRPARLLLVRHRRRDVIELLAAGRGHDHRAADIDPVRADAGVGLEGEHH